MAELRDLLSKINAAEAMGILPQNAVIFYGNGIGWQIHNLKADEPDPRIAWAQNSCSNSEDDTEKCKITELGPFGTKKIDIDLEVTANSVMCTIILPGDLARQFRSNDQPLIAQRAPIAPITLTGNARAAANIPNEATHFTWIYPPAGFTQKSKSFKSRIDKLVTGGDFQSTFLALGGFAYVNSANDPIRTVQINCLVQADTGLTFDGPFPWRSEFTDCLQRDGRFQSVTIADLLALGIQYYCFINPNEPLTDLSNNEKKWTPAANGAFVYLYNSDMKPHRFDCFFPIRDALATVKNTGLVRPFSIILKERSQFRLRRTKSEASRTISTPNSDFIPEQYRCIFCKDETITCLFIPCKHLCACRSCAEKLFQHNQTRCPLCQQVFEDVWDIFL